MICKRRRKNTRNWTWFEDNIRVWFLSACPTFVHKCFCLDLTSVSFARLHSWRHTWQQCLFSVAQNFVGFTNNFCEAVLRNRPTTNVWITKHWLYAFNLLSRDSSHLNIHSWPMIAVREMTVHAYTSSHRRPDAAFIYTRCHSDR